MHKNETTIPSRTFIEVAVEGNSNKLLFDTTHSIAALFDGSGIKNCDEGVKSVGELQYFIKKNVPKGYPLEEYLKMDSLLEAFQNMFIEARNRSSEEGGRDA